MVGTKLNLKNWIASAATTQAKPHKCCGIHSVCYMGWHIIFRNSIFAPHSNGYIPKFTCLTTTAYTHIHTPSMRMSFWTHIKMSVRIDGWPNTIYSSYFFAHKKITKLCAKYMRNTSKIILFLCRLHCGMALNAFLRKGFSFRLFQLSRRMTCGLRRLKCESRLFSNAIIKKRFLASSLSLWLLNAPPTIWMLISCRYSLAFDNKRRQHKDICHMDAVQKLFFYPFI